MFLRIYAALRVERRGRRLKRKRNDRQGNGFILLPIIPLPPCRSASSELKALRKTRRSREMARRSPTLWFERKWTSRTSQRRSKASVWSGTNVESATQSCTLPDRGFEIRRLASVSSVCRIQFGDTANWKSALQEIGADLRRLLRGGRFGTTRPEPASACGGSAR